MEIEMKSGKLIQPKHKPVLFKDIPVGKFFILSTDISREIIIPHLKVSPCYAFSFITDSMWDTVSFQSEYFIVEMINSVDWKIKNAF